jgi:hypothetical protein
MQCRVSPSERLFSIRSRAEPHILSMALPADTARLFHSAHRVGMNLMNSNSSTGGFAPGSKASPNYQTLEYLLTQKFSCMKLRTYTIESLVNSLVEVSHRSILSRYFYALQIPRMNHKLHLVGRISKCLRLKLSPF